MRKYDVAARLGGDEFIILMPNTNTSKAMERAQVMEQELNMLSIYFKESKINIRGSIGVREYTNGDSVESIISDADHSMYKEKESRKI